MMSHVGVPQLPLRLFVAGVGCRAVIRESQWYINRRVLQMLRLYVDNFEAVRIGLIAVAGLGSPNRPASVLLPEHISPVLIGVTGVSGRGGAVLRLLCYSRMWKAVMEADVVYARLPSPFGYAAIRLACLFRRSFFVSVHGDPAAGLVTGDERARHSYLTHIRARLAGNRLTGYLGRARHVFFMGSHLAERYGAGVRQATVVGNWLHSRGDVRDGHLRREVERLVYVGVLAKHKGVADLIQAFALLRVCGREPTLTIVGDGPERVHLEGLAASLGIQGRVVFRGWIDDDDELNSIYRESDLLVLPSYTEGTPKVVIEAMVRGVGVVATSVGGVPELLDHGARGWLAPSGDPSGLVAILSEAIADREETERRRMAGIEFALTHDFEALQFTIGERIRETVWQGAT